MKKLRLHPVAIAATTLLALGAQAQSLYGEVGYGQLKLQEDRFGSEVDPGMARGIIGYTLSPNLAVEGHLGIGVKDDTVRLGGVSVKGEVDNVVGAFVKPKVRLGDTVELFGRLGIASTKVKASSMGVSDSARGTDFSYGVGASFSLTPQLSLNADYMNYYDRKGIQLDGVTLGLGFSFY